MNILYLIDEIYYRIKTSIESQIEGIKYVFQPLAVWGIAITSAGGEW